MDMLLKQYSALVLIIASLFLICTEPLYARLSESGQQTGILWQIDRQGINPSYILATIHSDDSRVTHLPKIISQKLRQADSFVSELKMDYVSMQEIGQLMLLPDGQKLESLIGKSRYQTCLSLLTLYDIPADIVQRMKPWAVMLTLSMPKPRAGIVLDHLLYQEAKLHGKKTYGLETNHEQIAVFEVFSLQQQIVMLDDAITAFDRLSVVFDELIHYYLQRDLSGLERISEKYMLQGDSVIDRKSGV